VRCSKVSLTREMLWNAQPRFSGREFAQCRSRLRPVGALDALGETYAHLALAAGIDLALMHRVASISSGALPMLPHNGAVVTLLAICGATQRGSYREIMMVGIVGPLIALVTSRSASCSGHFESARL
jgi:hypothetical protein